MATRIKIQSGRAAAQVDVSDALYVISVAARLVELHPTTLRKYERVGFLEPSRTPGRTRLYSHDDIQRLQQIKRLVEQRDINLAGVELALQLTAQLTQIAAIIDEAPDLDTLRERVRPRLKTAFEAIGAVA
jgi:MerR family transcriptional regulator, heat shock protein HspR